MSLEISYISTPIKKKGVTCRKQGVFMDENSVSFQIFLILLSFITLGSESQISVFKQSQSNTQNSGGFFRGGWEHAQKPKFGDRRFFSEKKLHKALRSVQFLVSFISFYFEMLTYLACGETIIRLASKNSVELGEKLASDF